MSKRPTDHLEPSAKKRAGDRQISREQPPSDSEDEGDEGITNEFRRADEGTLKARRIFKARRGAGGVPSSASASGEAGGAAPAASNPFAGVALTPANSRASGNPFAGISLVPSATAQPAAAPASAQPPLAKNTSDKEAAGEPGAVPDQAQAAVSGGAAGAEADAAGGREADGAAAEGAEAGAAPAEEPKEDAALPAPAAGTTGEPAASSAATSPSAFASFAAATKASGFAGLSGAGVANGKTFGGGLGAFGNGSTLGSKGFASTFGGGSASAAAPAVSAPAPASSTFSFNTGGAASSFSFSTAPAAGASVGGGFPSVHNIFGGHPTPSGAVFGSGAESARPAPLALAEGNTARVTGEEEERTVFAGEGVLYEYDEGGQWRERGRGEMRVNVAHASGQARLVMRSKGQLRLLMNANLWPDMKITPMDGGKGVTFVCINAVEQPGEGAAKPSAAAAEEAKEKEGGAAEAAPAAPSVGKLGTFAFRAKPPGKLEEFRGAVEAHRAPAAGAENNV